MAGAGELLSQATCAVLKPDGSIAGTAWLVSDQGHLLTAGHVVMPMFKASQDEQQSMRPNARAVEVRFPDADPEPCRFVQPPVHDKWHALDFALLQLETSNDRKPLPVTLMADAEGGVRASGYGVDLGQSQHSGIGTLTGPYLRLEASNLFYFQYVTDSLDNEGFSGAAVYSDDAGAVIGLQVEKGNGTALAMPLQRIAEYWATLVDLARKPKGSCVLLQPSGGSEADRDTVRERIVRPVVQDLNLSMYVSIRGQTIGEDIHQLEHADVVIADITHDDHEVTYELTVAHGLGTPDVIIRDASQGDYRGLFSDVLALDLADVDGSQAQLRQRLVAVRSIFEALGRSGVTNPLTAFFHAPLTQVSAAHALALGYMTNFVRPIGRAMQRMRSGTEGGVITVEGQELPPTKLRDAELVIVLPSRLSWANDGYIRDRVAQPGAVVEATVDYAFSRPRQLKALPLEPDSPVRLVDVFPTTLSTMIPAIDERLGIHEGLRGDRADAWSQLEAKEIDLFHSKLIQRIWRDQTDDYGTQLREFCFVRNWDQVLRGFKPD